MFKYISEILKSFTPAQRILALLILVVSIIIISLGPILINSETQTCDELKLRIKSQEEQIIQLNTRVNELNVQLLSGQKECTDNLIAKQKEIINIVNGMINDAEKSPKTTIVKESNHIERMTIHDENSMESYAPPPPSQTIVVKDNSDMIKQLKNMKKKLEKNFTKQ